MVLRRSLNLWSQNCENRFDWFHDSTKPRYPAGYWSPVVRHLCQQIANTIHIVQTGCDPLVGALAAINHGPYEGSIEGRGYLQISAKGFESMSTPDIEARQRMPEGEKVRVIDVLVKGGGRAHSDSPMRRQRLVPHLNCLDFLKEVFKGVKNGCVHLLRSSWSQCMEGVPYMVIDRWPATEGP